MKIVEKEVKEDLYDFAISGRVFQFLQDMINEQEINKSVKVEDSSDQQNEDEFNRDSTVIRSQIE